MRLLKLLIIILICICCQSCSIHHQGQPGDYDPSTSSQAADILKDSLPSYSGLSSFKGTGTIRISSGTPIPSLRYAFAGTVSPPRLRLSVLDITGKPVESFSFDGNHIYLLSHNESHPFVRKKARGKTIEKFLSIPISPEDITRLFFGDIPMATYDTVYLTPSFGSESSIALVYQNHMVQKISIDDQKTIRTVEVLKKNGENLYSVTFEDYGLFSRYKIPTKTIISGNTGGTCMLTIDKYVPNAPLSQNIFILVPK